MASAAHEGRPPSEDAPPQARETSPNPGEEEAKAAEPDEGEISSKDEIASSEGQDNERSEEGSASAPPLPDEEAPPLPSEPVPGREDDGWDALWDDSSQVYYFHNRITGISQWENPRVPDPQLHTQSEANQNGDRERVVGGYDPAIHGDYDPTAWYAQKHQADAATSDPSADPNLIYTATGTFNRFTGQWQPAGLAPENFNDENKSRRQMNAYFDVDAAANSHEGKSLKAERSGKKLTKKELKAFKEKRRERKEEKRRAWLRD